MGLVVVSMSPLAGALTGGDAFDELPAYGIDVTEPPLIIAQRGCLSLSDAINQVRRNGNVERVISADTRVSGGRETHIIRVMTTDGRVETHRIPGCRVN